VLTGADGVIFVADSQVDRLEDNRVSLKDLEENLNYYGKKMETTPFSFQYNKRDLSDIFSIEELNQKMNRLNAPFFEAVAVSGKGVFETLTMVCRLVLKGISTGVETHRPSGVPDSAPKVVAARPLQMEGSIPRPDKPVPAVVATPPARELRRERDVAHPHPPPRAAPSGTSGRAGALRVEKEIPAEPPKPPRMSPGPVVRPSGELNSTSARSVLSRVAEKKIPEPPPKAKEGGEEMVPPAKEQLRILSCGQPRIPTPSSLEIPLTLEVYGLGKSLTFNLAIKLEQIDQKIT
jgi:hypothetical protein